MSLLYLVMFVFGENNIGFHFLNSHDHSLLSIVMFWGPSKVATSSGKGWFVTFIDDHTRFTWVFFITDKSKVSSIFQNFYHTIETQFNTKIVILRSDNGREFQNHNLSEFLISKGIVPQSSCATLLNKMGWLCEKPSSSRSSSVSYAIYFPSYLCVDAILIATYLINRMLSRVLHLRTPLEFFKESYPYTHLISFPFV